MSDFLLANEWWQELGGEFWVRRGMTKCLELMNFPGMWTHKFENFSHMVEYKSLRENSANILEKDKALEGL